jgi:hypothetical protein
MVRVGTPPFLLMSFIAKFEIIVVLNNLSVGFTKKTTTKPSHIFFLSYT